MQTQNDFDLDILDVRAEDDELDVDLEDEEEDDEDMIPADLDVEGM